MTLFEEGLQDRTRKVRAGQNPSGIGDYSSYGSIPDRAGAVGILIATGVDGVDVITGLSTGYAETLGHARYDMRQDFNFAKAKLGKPEPLRDQNGRTVLDENGKPMETLPSGLYKRMEEIDAEIEKKDAQERVVVLRQVQAMEKRNDTILRSLSINFEFMQANSEAMADRTSWNKPDKGSILNLFI
ncbi:hypothetical protein VZ95_20495 [Elstera litoralis]|uniref:Uncharacterized protein n=1 Tax=Elstera litoralis TaxID=552518 RepID=A0A0F3IJ86_9PROT|nr:hypothetical protein VZ95_20495 [Elstera litoralis]